MNKKIMIISILVVFMLLAIAFASTVTSNTQKPPKKESPLFGIRTRLAIREKIGDLMKRFVGEGVFFLPFQWIINKIFSSPDFTIDPPYYCTSFPCFTLAIKCV